MFWDGEWVRGGRRGPGSASLNQFNLRDSGVQLFHRSPGSRLARCYVLLQPRCVRMPSPRWRPRCCCIIHRNEDWWAPCYLLRRSELKSGPPLICSNLKKKEKRKSMWTQRNPLIESFDLEIYCGNTFLSSAAFVYERWMRREPAKRWDRAVPGGRCRLHHLPPSNNDVKHDMCHTNRT